MIWNHIPTVDNTPADVMIGSSGLAGENLSNPRGVFSDGSKLFVADSGNNRVLIYDPIPTTNDASASAVIGQPDMFHNLPNQGGDATSQTLNNPSRVCYDGYRLFVADSGNHRVLVYDLGSAPQATATPSATPSSTVTTTSTATAEPTSSATMTSTSTGTAMNTASVTSTSTSTPTSNETGTSTPTFTPTSSLTMTSSETPTATPTAIPTLTAVGTGTSTSTLTETFTPTCPNTETRTPTPTPTATATASQTVTPTCTPSATALIQTHTATPTIAVTVTLTPGCSWTDFKGKPFWPYPNPARHRMAFDLDLWNDAKVTITLFNLHGERVAAISATLSAGHQTMTWDCSHVAPGIYMAHMVVNGNSSGKLKVAVAR